MNRKILLSTIAESLSLKVIGDQNILIDGLNLCDRPTGCHAIIVYVTNGRYIDIIGEKEEIVCIILNSSNYELYKQLTGKRKLSFLISECPEETFYKIHQWLISDTDFYRTEIETVISEGGDVHKTALIEEGTSLGKNVKVGANAVIKRGSILGDNVVIGCNTVIGSEGFQIISIHGRPEAIQHVGGVNIGNNVYIGDNTTVCNALFEGDTNIGNNVKIDNLVHIAHNCYIGENAVVTAGCILCGSSIIDKGSWVGVNSSILNKVVLAENTLVGIGSVVTRNTKKDSLVYGSPAKDRFGKGGS